MERQTQQPNEEDSGLFEPEINSRFEPLLVTHVFEPLVNRLPYSLAPNTISLLGHIACWSAGISAWLSTLYLGWQKAIALVFTGFMMLLALTADSLDGMQARRTGQTSKLGELLDHWLDSIHTPIVSASITLALGLDPWLIAFVHLSTTMIYNGQILLYYHRRRFVHPPTSGVDGQFGTAIGFFIAAVYLGVFGPHYWTNMALGMIALIVQLRLNFFFWRRMSIKELVPHLLYILYGAALISFFFLQWIGTLEFALAIIFLSFRVTGSFVMASVLRYRFSGVDLGLILFLVAEVFSINLNANQFHFHGAVFSQIMIWGLILYLVLRNLIDFIRVYPELRPRKGA